MTDTTRPTSANASTSNSAGTSGSASAKTSTNSAAANNLAAELRLTPEQLAERTKNRHAGRDVEGDAGDAGVTGVTRPTDFATLSMLQRMIAGQLYRADDSEIRAASIAGKSAAQAINRLDFDDDETRNRMLAELLGTFGEGATVIPDITVDYGFNIHIGDHTFVNFHSVFLDVCPITIGDHCQIGPRAQFLTPLHPIDNVDLRAAEWEYGAPITLEDNVWLAGGVTVCAGVTIGADTVVGAGSVVTRDLPPGVVAVGSPARVIRELRQEA